MITQDEIAKWQAADKAHGDLVLEQLRARWPLLPFRYESGGGVHCTLPLGVFSVNTDREGWMDRMAGKIGRFRLQCQGHLDLTKESK